ncbi:MAG: DUF2474 family protein [Paracoccaceae bacterium]
MQKTKLPTRLLWFAGLWLASVVTLGLIAYAIKLVIL